MFRIKTKYRRIKNNFHLGNNKLYERITGYEPISVANSISLTWEKAKDFSIYDSNGNKWIDLTSGIFVANSGHSNPFIKRAIRKQIDSDLMFSYNYPIKIREKFLKKLLSLSPSHFEKVILLNSGSEAVEVAYKLIRLWAKNNNRKYIITFNGSYHGRGLSNDLICGNKNKADWSGVVDKNIVFIDFPYCDDDFFDITKLPPPDQIAAFFLETFQGWGSWFYPQNYIKDLINFAKKHGCLVAFDEMQSGFYRLGPIYGYLTYGNFQPDIICLGKGISSSLPISAVLSRKEIVDIDPKADLHGTQSGNPLCCAAALANIKFLSNKKQLNHNKEIEKVFFKKLTALKKYEIIKKINVRGLIAGLIVKDADIATKIVKECINNGVLPVCTNRNSIKISPPLTIASSAIIEAIEVIESVIKKFS